MSSEALVLAKDADRLEAAAMFVGRQGALRCAECGASVPRSSLVAGRSAGWPYCRVHPDKPLMVFPTSFDPIKVLCSSTVFSVLVPRSDRRANGPLVCPP